MRAIAAADLQSNQHRPQAAQSLHASMLQPVQGLILDSAPCRLTPDISARLAHDAQWHSLLSDSNFGMLLIVLTVQRVAYK